MRSAIAFNAIFKFFIQNFELSRQLPLETQSKVATYMKLDCQSDSECSVGNLSKAKYQILPTTDEDVLGTSLENKFRIGQLRD